ncbi:MAG: DUF3784 domain-containing protein [Clostridiales bacterium]|nr:DUF3784 domain-containing protein [Clostridiales bacterium]
MGFANVSSADWIIVVLLALISIVLISGHGKWLIAGYNTASEKEKEKYDSKKLCRTVGVGMAVATILALIDMLFENVLPTEFDYVMGSIILVDVVIMIIFSNTICRKK